jgi:diguanylate cyclase (GGDEF)-like protein
LVGLAGWAAIARLLPAGTEWPSPGACALFLIVVAGARGLAFPLVEGEAEISLDSAIFIAAIPCLGARPTALGVAAVMSIATLLRGLREPKRRLLAFARTLFVGGISGGLLAVWTRAFHVGHGAPSSPWLIPAVGLCFLASYYGLSALEERVSGRRLRGAIRRNTTRMLAEASLLPLASAIVLIWDPLRPVPFALLGATYLLVNWGFQRVAKLAAAMRRRVLELETLSRTAHVLGSSLETAQFLPALLRETAHALPGAVRLEAIVSSGGSLERFVLDARGRESREPAGPEARRWLKLSGPTLEGRHLAVPLTMYGAPLGALVAEGADDESFGLDELRLLDAISGQAATAVENARLYGLANIDGLTGLYVRRYFDARIAEEIERARRFSSSFALIMMDLDDFKRLNDTLGHLAGDRALREVAAIAASQLRGVDLAARYGGEELAFLLPRTSLTDAQQVAERIRDSVASHRIAGDGQPWKITASLGVAAWTESGVDDAASLLARADAALYRAKAAGKNRVELDLVSFELTPSLAPIRRRRA